MRSVCVNHLLATAPIHSPTATAKRSSAGRLTHPVTYPPCPASITRALPPSSASAAAAEPPRRPLEVERETPPASFCHHCLRVSKRSLLLGASSAMLPVLPAASAFSGGPPSHPAATLERIHPPRPDWYEELFAKAMDQGMKSYEAEVSVYKKKLFGKLTDKSKNLVELGVGTAPNFRYYVNAADRYVIGVDPNKQMEKYARASADAAGLQSKNFSFIQGVGEYLDLRDNTVDAVIGTLVLCSVNDVAMTLREVRRVLKPGGLYVFIEHVAARDGSFLRFTQNILDPLQQFVADGCHLTRDTGKHISEAGFSDVSLQMAFLSSVSIISPHVYGIACK